MKLTNNSTRMICIDGKFIAPGNTEIISDVWANNPVLAEYIATGAMSLGEKVAKEEPVEVVEEPKTLESYTKDELKAMAEEQGIDLTGAKTKDQIIALMKG